MTSLEDNSLPTKQRLDMTKYSENSNHSPLDSSWLAGIESEPINLPIEEIDKSESPDKRINQDSSSSKTCSSETCSLIGELNKYKTLIDCILAEQPSSLDDFRTASRGVKRRKLTKNQPRKKAG